MHLRTKNGCLFFDFSWKGVRCREYTGLRATAENRRSCEKKLEIIRRQIERGIFDYRNHFPAGGKLAVFYPDERPSSSPKFKDWIFRWHGLRSPFRPDGSVASNPELHPSTWLHEESVIGCHLVPAFGKFRLDQIDVTRVNAFRRGLTDKGLGGKTVTNVMGILHKTFSDALEEGLIEANPVLRVASRGQMRVMRERSKSEPLRPEEIAAFLRVVLEQYRDLYSIWFRTGWRPSEIVAVRLSWLDFDDQVVHLKRGRIPRRGGLEAPPKTGLREVDCSYDPEIFAAFTRLAMKRPGADGEGFVFANANGEPLSQEWLHKRVWLPTLAAAGISRRGQYNIRDTFITLALSAGEDPGWAAKVCGTSEQMIFKHYRRWMPDLRKGDGGRLRRLIDLAAGGKIPAAVSPDLSPGDAPGGYVPDLSGKVVVEAGGIEPPSGGVQSQRLRV